MENRAAGQDAAAVLDDELEPEELDELLLDEPADESFEDFALSPDLLLESDFEDESELEDSDPDDSDPTVDPDRLSVR
ncbi:hypothetical protein GCM10009722_06960 [Williamsia deligens]